MARDVIHFTVFDSQSLRYGFVVSIVSGLKIWMNLKWVRRVSKINANPLWERCNTRPKHRITLQMRELLPAYFDYFNRWLFNCYFMQTFEWMPFLWTTRSQHDPIKLNKIQWNHEVMIKTWREFIFSFSKINDLFK